MSAEALIDMVRRRRTVPLADVPLDLRVIVISSLAVLSGGPRWFDAALVGYQMVVLLAVSGAVYRYLIWLQRPPTARMYRLERVMRTS